MEGMTLLATAADGVEVALAASQPHHAMAAMMSTAVSAATSGETMVSERRGTATGAFGVGSSAIVSGRKAKTRTGRAIFLTACSPLSSSG
jgi:hypothetical protein